MSPLTRLLLIPAALLWATAAPAQEMKGAPKELVGYYAKDEKACRAARNNSYEGLAIISRGKHWDEFSDCAGKECRAKILTHRTTSSGYSLKLIYGDSTEWSMTITRISKGAYQFLSKDGDSATFVRCQGEDVTAELGRPQRRGSAEEDKLYSYSYALAAGTSCPGLEVATERFPSNFNWNVNYPDNPQSPVVNANFDHENLRTFCQEILGAFGMRGRVISDLVRAVPANAKTIAQTPKILEGVFVQRAEKCAAFSEDDGMRLDISRALDSCGGRVCQRQIVSHRMAPDGFILNIREWNQNGNGPTSDLRFKVIDRDTIVYIAPRPTILHRCPS